MKTQVMDYHEEGEYTGKLVKTTHECGCVASKIDISEAGDIEQIIIYGHDHLHRCPSWIVYNPNGEFKCGFSQKFKGDSHEVLESWTTDQEGNPIEKVSPQEN
jgi:hypothetical protein